MFFYRLIFPALVVVGACSVVAGVGLLRLWQWARVVVLLLWVVLAVVVSVSGMLIAFGP